MGKIRDTVLLQIKGQRKSLERGTTETCSKFQRITHFQFTLIQKMLENRPEDALVLLVETVEIV